MNMIEDEGIVLKSVDFKEGKRIITVLTCKFGLISLIVHGLSKKKASLFQLTSPLCHIDFSCEKKGGEIYRFKEGHILDAFFSIRQSFQLLTIAGKMMRVLIDFLLPEKPAPALYLLFRNYLKQLPHFAHPHLICTSFFLKFLIHEGLFSLEKQETSTLLHFSHEEWETLTALTEVKNFQELDALNSSEKLNQKIEQMLKECTKY